jgi:signal transduction histidine kinase/CHASE3 domain sensor protein
VSKPVVATLRRQFVWLVAALFVISCLQLAAGQVVVSRYEREVSLIRAAELANQQVLQLLTDAETGVRGYQLTGDSRFLEPYRSGVVGYPTAMHDAMASGTEDVQRLLELEQVSAHAWLTEFAEPAAIVYSGNPAVAGVDSGAGKDLFDAVRRGNRAVADELRSDERRAISRFRRLAAAAQIGIGALSLIAIGLTLFTALRTNRLLLYPLVQLSTVLQRFSRGNHTARASTAGSEIQHLAAIVHESLDATARAEADRRATHDAAALKNTYFVEILDTLNVAVVSCDPDGVLVYRNRVARNALGETEPHVDNVENLTTDDPRHPLARVLAGEVFINRELTLHPPGQPDQAVLVDAHVLTGADGTIIGAVASGYDVTILREREAELAAFAGVVAHDLKAPLAIMLGLTELLILYLPTDEDTDEMRTLCGRITGSITRMSNLIDDLLAYATARDKPLHLSMVDLNAVVRQITTDRTAATPAGAVREPPWIDVDGLSAVCADAGMIRQLLDNLIGNAVKYTRPGEAPQVHVWAATPHGTDLELHVDDHGIGIPTDQQAHVFTAFHRAHAEQSYAGTGLGLAICERVATRHHGTITAETNPTGGGTRITVTLPRKHMNH